MKKLLSTFRIGMALFLAVFSSNLLPVATAYATTQPWSEPTNHETYWESLDYGVCSKTDYPENTTATSYTMPSAPSGSIWSLLVIKAGLFNEVYENPVAGQTYNSVFDDKGDSNPNNDGFKKISHIITCTKPITQTINIPATPNKNDLCGVGNAAWIKPADTAQITWTLEQDGDLVATTTAGYVFTDGLTSYNYGQVIETNTNPCFTPAVCEVPRDGGLITQNTAGWSTSANAQFVDGGVKMTSSDWNDSMVTFTGNYPVSQVLDLDWAIEGEADVTGYYGIGIILELENGATVHYEPNVYTNDFWTNTPGLLPSTPSGQGGPYSGSLQDILDKVGNMDVVKTSFVFTSQDQNEVLLTGLSFNCAEYTFDKQETPVDVCPNVPGTQLSRDDCGQVQGDTNVCPNITGSQATLPAGYTQVNGQCIAPVGGGGAGQVLGTTLPTTLPATGGVAMPNPLFSIIAGFFTYLFLSRRNRKAEA